MVAGEGTAPRLAPWPDPKVRCGQQAGAGPFQPRRDSRDAVQTGPARGSLSVCFLRPGTAMGSVFPRPAVAGQGSLLPGPGLSEAAGSRGQGRGQVEDVPGSSLSPEWVRAQHSLLLG